jgi:hypothetical protein
MAVRVDIKPQSWHNPLLSSEPGVVPVVTLGSINLDVSQIDPTSAQGEGVSRLPWAREAVTACVRGIVACSKALRVPRA